MVTTLLGSGNVMLNHKRYLVPTLKLGSLSFSMWLSKTLTCYARQLNVNAFVEMQVHCWPAQQ
jgi:hypothetical protein